MEILLLEIGDIGRGRVADMDLAGGVFAKVVSNPVQFGLAFNLHLRGDAGVAANVSSDEVEVDGIKPDLESTELLIVQFPFSTVNENIDSPAIVQYQRKHSKILATIFLLLPTVLNSRVSHYSGRSNYFFLPY